jgi:hypothetical protein
LQAGEHLGLALALSRDVSTFAPLLVSDRHSSDWPAKPRRFIDGRIDLDDTPIKVGDCSTLDPEASFDVCGSVGEGKIYGCHVVEVGAREEAEHTDGVQPHQHANHQDQDEAQEGWRRGPMLRQPGCRNLLSGLQHCAMMMMGQKTPAKIAVRPSMEKAADTQGSARATTKAASLTGVVERRALSAPDILVTSAASVTAAVSSVTVGVTDPLQ